MKTSAGGRKAVYIIKKLCSLILAASLLNLPYAQESPSISAEKAVLMSYDGTVIYEKNSHSRAAVASTTKIMTAILVIENCSLSDNVEIKPECCNIEGSSMYLRPGEHYSVYELLKGLLLVSGNDAAVALACHTSGSVEGFVRRMNQKVREFGLKDTHFDNPHGLDSPEHYSSACDMAKIMAYAVKNPHFARICRLKSSAVGDKILVNHNKLLTRCEGCTGGKTGYTLSAGRCLVSCCERNGTKLICVTLSAPDDWRDHMALYDWGFDNFSLRNPAEGLRFEVPIISGISESAVIKAGNDKMLLPKEAEIVVKAYMPKFVFAPVYAGDAAGHAEFYLNGELIGSAVLYFEETVLPQK